MSPLALLLLACHPDEKGGGDSETAAPPVSVTQVIDRQVFYFGDPHVHTGYSGDGRSQGDDCPDCGRFEDVFEASREAGLSWIAVSDHVNEYAAMSASDFDAELAAVQAANDPDGGFLTIPSAEVWFSAGEHELGHKNALFFGDDETLASLNLHDVQPAADGGMDVGDCDSLWSWADDLDARLGPVLLIPHHPAGVQPMPTDWTCANADFQPVVEVYSEQGSALDDGTGFDPPWSGTLARGTIPVALEPDGLALKMGFIAGTDGHDTRPGDVCLPDLVRTNQPYGGGLTAVVLDESQDLSRASLLAAFQARSTIATSGPLIPLSVRWSAGEEALGGVGADLQVPAGEALTLTARLPDEDRAAVLSVEAVGPDGRLVASADDSGAWTVQIEAADLPAWLYVAVRLDGDVLYGEGGCEDGGDSADEWLWSSPSWVTVAPAAR